MTLTQQSIQLFLKNLNPFCFAAPFNDHHPHVYGEENEKMDISTG